MSTIPILEAYAKQHGLLHDVEIASVLASAYEREGKIENARSVFGALVSIGQADSVIGFLDSQGMCADNDRLSLSGVVEHTSIYDLVIHAPMGDFPRRTNDEWRASHMLGNMKLLSASAQSSVYNQAYLVAEGANDRSASSLIQAYKGDSSLVQCGTYLVLCDCDDENDLTLIAREFGLDGRAKDLGKLEVSLQSIPSFGSSKLIVPDAELFLDAQNEDRQNFLCKIFGDPYDLRSQVAAVIEKRESRNDMPFSITFSHSATRNSAQLRAKDRGDLCTESQNITLYNSAVTRGPAISVLSAKPFHLPAYVFRNEEFR